MILAIFHYLEDNNSDITAPSIVLWNERRLAEAERKDSPSIAEIEVVVPVVEPVVGAGEIK
jgi:hypothetical protein